ncbi:MAG: DEDD exonuclease domain-containing protein [Acidimicrobiia bacterium]|nr:DEDD exonuclease domain-containing protein [Acidimicrobiia bacterium]
MDSGFFQPSFDDLSTPLFDVTFCVLDLETTGAVPSACEITEIGAVKYRGGELVGTFQTFVDPGAPIPPSITFLTGITHAMVADAPKVDDILPTFLEFIGNAVIVGHNVRFDMSFLEAAARRLGIGPLPNKTSDTARLARRLVRGEVRNLKLRTLAAHFRSPITPNHRALEDARATAHVFHALLERAGTLGVTNLDDLLQLPTARGAPHYRKLQLTDGLPRRPGVYMFKDRDGRILYVGKATNLRARVRQYFYGDTRRSVADMLRELDSIDHWECPTTLEAEVAELRMIHTHRPRYNRRSRPPKASHFVKVTKEAFPRLSIARTLRGDGLAYLGPFRSKRAADLVVSAIWDALPVRRCMGRPGARSGPCVAGQIGVARCPCDGSLEKSEYQATIQRLLLGIDDEPRVLLQPLAEKMRRLSESLRYEEAGWARDRHDALASALGRRHEWRALQAAGMIEVEAADGSRTIIDHGILVGSPTDHIGVLSSDPQPVTQVPPSVQSAEEARVIWRWLTSEPVRIVDSTAGLSLPLRRAERLTPAA